MFGFIYRPTYVPVYAPVCKPLETADLERVFEYIMDGIQEIMDGTEEVSDG